MRAPEFSHTLLCEAALSLPSEEVRDNIRVIRRGNRLTLHWHALKWNGPHDLCVESVAHAVPFYRGRLTSDRTIVILFHLHQRLLFQELNALQAALVSILERTLRYRTAHFVAISESTRRDAIDVLGITAPISVVTPGVDTSRFSPARKDDPATFLYLGMLKRYKRVDHIIEAFKKVGRHSVLKIAGSGYDRSRLEKIADKRGDILFLGHVTEGKRAELLQQATANILASTNEGFGLTILEAAASGTPTVAYDAGPVRESIQDGLTGALARDGDVSDLARAMAQSIDHPEWGINARETSLIRTWDETGEKFSNLVRSVCSMRD
jgi:glycosyltransferase involved in cell wall biosynthesis